MEEILTNSDKSIKQASMEVSEKMNVNNRNAMNWYNARETIKNQKNSRFRHSGGGRKYSAWKIQIFEKLHTWFVERRETLQCEVHLWDVADQSMEIADEQKIDFDYGFLFFFVIFYFFFSIHLNI